AAVRSRADAARRGQPVLDHVRSHAGPHCGAHRGQRGRSALALPGAVALWARTARERLPPPLVVAELQPSQVRRVAREEHFVEDEDRPAQRELSTRLEQGGQLGGNEPNGEYAERK